MSAQGTSIKALETVFSWKSLSQVDLSGAKNRGHQSSVQFANIISFDKLHALRQSR